MAQRMSSQRIIRILPQCRRCWFSNLLLLALVLLYSTTACIGQVVGADLEMQVKAAYIFNFTKFVYWEGQAAEAISSPITIFVLGTETIGGLLENFSKKQTSGHPIIVKKINAETNDLSSCHLFFIGQSAKQQLPEIFKRLPGTNVLTVSDIPDFARLGGMIGFIIEDGRVKIEINPRAVSKSGLQISAKLLEVAKMVSSED